MEEKQKQQAKLIGLGLDNTDGHKRVTQSERFSIVGGSEETHECLTETAIKTFETLDKKGKTLETVDKEELNDIIQDALD
ncbi:MAG: hypothetical protein DBX03_00610 [Puniceicoccaceae bacterium]|nr:MAG: hypothetical protein DBX03_00610 [Puniceicoccaceae bacterium]